MEKYHKYVFDIKNRKFVGQFEDMYINEDKDNFDSWFQEDITHLKTVISLSILNQYNFNTILDVGCGKGTITHLLKKKNNYVLGVDISKTAINKAKVKYPEIDFQVLKSDEILLLNKEFDLVIAMEILSYLENWKNFIEKVSKISNYFFISLYIPPNPIGFVKTFEDLSNEVEKYFEIVTKIINETENNIFILAQNKTNC
jgi:SAM-dependent methyltransferase